MYQKHSSYLGRAFADTNVLVEDALKVLKDVEYDTMIGSGTSGLLVIPVLARALNKYFAIVRKPKDASHKDCDIEGNIGERWIFVDDFVSSGATRNRVKTAIELASKGSVENTWPTWPAFSTELIGTYEYNRSDFLSAKPRRCVS